MGKVNQTNFSHCPWPLTWLPQYIMGSPTGNNTHPFKVCELLVKAFSSSQLDRRFMFKGHHDLWHNDLNTKKGFQLVITYLPANVQAFSKYQSNEIYYNWWANGREQTCAKPYIPVSWNWDIIRKIWYSFKGKNVLYQMPCECSETHQLMVSPFLISNKFNSNHLVCFIIIGLHNLTKRSFPQHFKNLIAVD